MGGSDKVRRGAARRWPGAGGAATLALILLAAAAVATIACDVVPRFRAPQVSLPLQRTRLSEYGRPAVTSIAGGGPVELGARVRPAVSGSVIGVRFYRLDGDVGPHVGSVWSDTGQRLATASFREDAAPGWHEVLFAAPVNVSANEMLIVSYFSPAGGEMATGAHFLGAGVPPVLDAHPAYFQSRGSARYPVNVFHAGGPGFPSQVADRAFWVDLVFVPAAASR